ncbi:uncharacterized protein LOC122298644 [Carya illinoinensis]|uniref:uncharacterized protein LOC122298644 n=1 Tax=Carya illinoinensis TaxID=32201 RepID=UPI001C722A1C|nr:uncharacterized protein LOC122298644 [Carya illinoinensis]
MVKTGITIWSSPSASLVFTPSLSLPDLNNPINIEFYLSPPPSTPPVSVSRKESAKRCRLRLLRVPKWHRILFGTFSEINFSMESSDDEKDGIFGNYIPTELTRVLVSSGVNFVDQVVNGQNELCLDNFRMDKHVCYKLGDILRAEGLVRHTNRIKIEEQLANLFI